MMGKIKINMTFDGFTLRQATVRSVITRCIHAALKDQSVDVPCEINVLITNDKGIQAINKASRDMDKPTDVLSFPMFQLEAGELPADWIRKPACAPLGTWRSPLNGLLLRPKNSVTVSVGRLVT